MEGISSYLYTTGNLSDELVVCCGFAILHEPSTFAIS